MVALMAFVISPVASLAHDLADMDHQCETSAASDLSDTSNDEKPAHGQHAHQCGSCHGHMLSPVLVFAGADMPGEKAVPGATLSVPSPLAYGLFRPPRG